MFVHALTLFVACLDRAVSQSRLSVRRAPSWRQVPGAGQDYVERGGRRRSTITLMFLTHTRYAWWGGGPGCWRIMSHLGGEQVL